MTVIVYHTQPGPNPITIEHVDSMKQLDCQEFLLMSQDPYTKEYNPTNLKDVLVIQIIP